MGVDYSNTDLFWSYGTHYRFCDRLAEAAVVLPSTEWGDDPIRHFVDADAFGAEIKCQDCLATSYRMRDLVDTFSPREEFREPGRLLQGALEIAAEQRRPFRIY